MRMPTTAAARALRSDSAQVAARAAGVLWLTCILAGLFAFVLESTIVVRNDAVRTAANIVARESLFRLDFAADLISAASYLGVTALLCYLLNPVGRSLSLMAAFFGATGVAIGGVAFLAHIAPVFFLRGDQNLAPFKTTQLQAFALLALELRLQVFTIGMVFFGMQCFLVGHLIRQSTFLPRSLGTLLAIGGSSYVVVSFCDFLVPSLGPRLTSLFMPIALVGEGALTVWLLARGVDVRRWHAQASGDVRGPLAV